MFEAGDNPLINDVVVCEVRSGLLPHERIALEALLQPLELVQPGPEVAPSGGRLARRGASARSNA
jgi:hypothetical protein